ncbi:ArsR family transcriptional regulator [Paenibacillus sp. 1011MAR3C5]|uniref:ArsR/SmtB family transcription factor n=1 Tax=Paenibacillus sp. 1011MAR3C5 TaxID=1675787 RepID=UPI000E6C0BCD|nr:metalloregulator ArsR/SmtB family transcription factor [Paenibacillus sp. 1011MAR3C5]RJE91406.1 ArsR family transcriptional regulator [Paenibacillus sp. 1011MAR3C5]
MEQDVMNRTLRDFKSNQAVLLAIGNETRQAILITLAQRAQDSGMRVGEIGQYTHLSRPALAHHLKVLKDAGIVSVHKEGTKNYYRIHAIEKLQDIRNMIDIILSLCK